MFVQLLDEVCLLQAIQFVVVVTVVVVAVFIVVVEHDHTGAHDHHGHTVSLILAFLATPCCSLSQAIWCIKSIRKRTYDQTSSVHGH